MRQPLSGSWQAGSSNQYSQCYDGGIGGIEADLKVLSPTVYAGSLTRSAIQIKEGCATADKSFAAMGWEKYADGSMHTYTKWADAEGTVHLYESCSAGTVGNIYTYKVLYDHDAYDALSFYRAGTQCGTTTGTIDWPPNAAAVFSKIDNYASQMPGGYTSGYNESWSATNWYYSGGWNPLNGTAFADGAGEFGSSAASGGIYYSVWDNACAT